MTETPDAPDLLSLIQAREREQLPSPLVYGAIGDAYGFGLEFASSERVARDNQLIYLGNDYWNTPPGHYSDDTQMQLALAEMLSAGTDWTPLNLAEAFVSVFKRDPRPGYAKRFYRLLQEIRDGRAMLEILKPYSERNGAAMRAPVLGLLPDLADIKTRARVQASITHDTPGGVDSAIASALISHYFNYNLGPKQDLPDFLDQQVPGHDWAQPWHGEVPCHGISTIRAVLSALLSTDTISELLRTCIAFSGDVDSVATIALAAASGSAAFKRDLPERLWTGFEQTAYGLGYLLEAEARLLATVWTR